MFDRRFVVAFVAGLVIAPSVAAAAVDVRMNPNDPPGSVQNEVSLAMNLNPGGLVGPGQVNLLAAYNDDPGNLAGLGGGLGVSFSLDSGATWTERTIGTGIVFLDPVFGPTGFSNAFDPITAADTQGNLFAGYIATTNNSGDANGLYVERSTDGGNTWSGPVAVKTDPAALGMNAGADPTYRFNDKPHLAADTTGGAFNDNLYATWIQDVGGTTNKSDIRFARSTDGGVTWSVVPATLNTNAGLDLANGPNVAVTPNGDVYVAWIDVDVTNNNPGPKNGTLMFNRSIDGGVTFQPAATAISTVASLPNQLSTLNNQLLQDDARARGFPVIDADPNDATGRTLYLTYAADPDGTIAGDEADVFFIRSTDAGATWSNPLRVNDDLTINDQFNPWMDVKADGTIDIAWYDKRASANDDLWDVYIARSTDGGLSFSANTLITDASFASTLSAANQPWLGEYLGLVVDANTAYLGFVARGDANGDVYFDAIPNAAIGGGPAVPEPSTALLLAAVALAALPRRPTPA